MDSTKSFVKVYNVSPESAEDFEFDYTTESSDLLSELVPNYERWGDIGWVELEEYEYNHSNNTLHLTLETKWQAPIRWLQQASYDTPYFENKLITMCTIQKDETAVTGHAVMDGETLQSKELFTMSSEDVQKYYDDNSPDYDLDDLDNQIWDSIGQFMKVCEKFYGNDTE
mgnify:CR=1 FL=1